MTEDASMLSEAYKMMREDDTLQEYIRTRREIKSDYALRHHYAQLLKLKQVGQAERAQQEDWNTKKIVKQVKRALSELKGACKATEHAKVKYNEALGIFF